MKTIPNNKLAILGFGREGQSTLRFLLKQNKNSNITILDQNPDLKSLIKQNFPHHLKKINFQSGSQYLTDLNLFHIVYKTPGINPHQKEIITAKKKGIIFSSNTKLFFEICKGKIIGITGSKGKSTTTSLIYHLLKQNKIKTKLIGNIGTPALDFLGHNKKDVIYCMELSSFQLMDLTQSPHIAVFHHVFPEHLDYHKNFTEYLKAKQNIALFQTNRNHFIYNANSPTAIKTSKLTLAKLHPFQDVLPNFLKAENIMLPGKHNLYNVQPAIIIGKILHLSQTKIKKAVRTFNPLPHRLENAGTYQTISFIDDSLATNPEATIAAIQTYQDNLGTIILGGASKNLDYSKLINPLQQTEVKNIILFPPTGDKIHKTLKTKLKKTKFFPVKSMVSAIKLAYKHTPSNTVCLLSTASPSFGIFKDYTDRGNQFKKYAQQLGI